MLRLVLYFLSEFLLNRNGIVQRRAIVIQFDYVPPCVDVVGAQVL